MLEELDAIDRKLLSLLQQDGRMSNADLARSVRMAPSAVFEREIGRASCRERVCELV